jgi:hypothetical protein
MEAHIRVLLSFVGFKIAPVRIEPMELIVKWTVSVVALVGRAVSWAGLMMYWNRIACKTERAHHSGDEMRLKRH